MKLSDSPGQITNEDIEALERFLVLLYKRTSALASLKQARKTLFAPGRQLDHIPPTSGAVLQHTKRAVYQA